MSAFVTAHYGLIELGDISPGDKVLIHAAAGGVGMAAVQIAQRFGAEVYATASSQKHSLVARMGIPAERIADSRSLSFEEQLREATHGRGFNIVLGSLKGEFVDASLRLLAPGGRYLEMGKTDVRDPSQIRALYPGLDYFAFDLSKWESGQGTHIVKALAPAFTQGVYQPLPVRQWSLERTREALRALLHGHTVGKAVVMAPDQWDPEGTVLITGGTGTLGSLLAKHLTTSRGMRHLVLTSRHATSAPHARELVAELEKAGARVTLADCDVTDREQLAVLIGGIPTEYPLTAVVHAAGTTDDALLEHQSASGLESVWASKAAAAYSLHELTQQMTSVKAFIMFSSLTSTLGTAGQANYSAANAFLDSLAWHRQSLGLPATALSWGLWEEKSQLTSPLTKTDRDRLAMRGIHPLTTEHALAAFDRACTRDEPVIMVTPTPFAGPSVSPLFARVAAPGRRPMRQARRTEQTSTAPLHEERAELLLLSASDRSRRLLALVCGHAAAVLGYTDTSSIDPDVPFRDTGFDSLATVELRTRLNQVLGIRLPVSTLFDYPTPRALASHLDSLVVEPTKTQAE
ncbi:SDR family NAD(P)-dependent oxidoreductase [Streptomyces sp. NPDC056534]|uniref:SDR family NAD(P)-dependent oxidoreductase n=1 Tax=Streptomyces sp. NPDC056534 TaxID=3345857 RepID=UPI0036A017C2